jgi:hypothetical protein
MAASAKWTTRSIGGSTAILEIAALISRARTTVLGRRNLPERVTSLASLGESWSQILHYAEGRKEADVQAALLAFGGSATQASENSRLRFPSRLRRLIRRLLPYRLPSEPKASEVLTQPVGVVGFSFGQARNREQLATRVQSRAQSLFVRII